MFIFAEQDAFALFYMQQLKPCLKKRPSTEKQFFISVPVKTYVKRFLHLNYGDPVYFHPDKIDYSVLRECLAESRKHEPIVPETGSPYKDVVTILLSERDFYRYGWDMNKTSIVRFGIHFERRAKTLMRNMVGIYHGLGLPINVSICKFQDRFYFDEDTWAYQSIKKDFYRNGMVTGIDFDGDIFKKIEKIVMTNLYNLGTVSETLIKDYENDQQTG